MTRSRIWMLVLAAGLVVAVFFVWRARSQGKDKWRTMPVETGTIAKTVSATGTIEPVAKVDVGSQVSGTIAKLGADYNDHVKKGQMIAQLDPSLFQAAVAQAQANLAHAQAGADNANRTYVRSKELFTKGVIAQVDMDAAEATYRQAVADVKQGQATLGTAQLNLRHATITAPIDGVIISRSIDVGQTVAASLSAPQLFEIGGDLTHMQVETLIDEADIGGVQPGLHASFTVDAFPDATFRGTVRQVRLEPVSTQNVVTYTTVVDVPNPDLKLKPGMTANVTVGIERRQNVLKVPNAALRFHPPDDTKGAGGAAGGGAAGGGRALAQGGGGGGGGGNSAAGNAAFGGPDSSQGGARDTSRHGGRGGRGGAGGGAGGRGGAGGGAGGGADSAHGGGRGNWAGRGGRGAQDPHAQVVYVVDANGKPAPVQVTTGITDGSFTELVAGNIAAGTQVIVGAAIKGAPAAATTTLPPGMGGGFRGPGGGGGGGGGGRGGGR